MNTGPGSNAAGETLTFRSDFRIWDNELQEGGAIAGSIEADKYLIIPPLLRAPVAHAIEALRDGRASIEIQAELREQGWDLNVGELVGLLASKQLVSGRFDAPHAAMSSLARPNDEISSFSKTLLNLRVHKPRIRPEQVRHITVWLVAAVGMLLFVDLLSIALAPQGGEIGAALLQSGKRFGAAAWGASSAGLFILAACSFAVHEAGHVLVARRYGLYLRSVQFRFYRIFQSYLAVQIPGLCTLSRRAQVEVALAGPLANLALGLFLASLVLLAPLPTVAIPLLMVGAFANVVGGLSNLNPFLPSDGYRFFSLVLFKNSDIRSCVVAKVRASGLRSLSAPERAYLVSYVLSTAALLFGSNWFFASTAFRLFGPLVRTWVLACAVAAALAAIDWAFIRRTVRFFRGRV